MFGGAGNDVFVLNASNTAALQATGLSGGQFARVVGGGGVDTLRLSGGAALNLAAIANVGAGTPDGLSRLESLEKIDLLTDTGANTLTLATRDVVDVSGMNVFNSTAAGGSVAGLGSVVQRHQLWVDGGSNDALTVTDGLWTSVATVTSGGQTYRVFDHQSAAVQLIVDTDIATTIADVNVQLSDIARGAGGFVINGQCTGDQSGYSVSNAGDVNGDGLDDVIVGAFQADPAAGLNAGRSYVVFGRTASTAVGLSAVAAGSGGFVINGQCSGDWAGADVSAAGDLNGDGLADLLVGAYLSDPAAGTSS
jgi:hypothetical protein